MMLNKSHKEHETTNNKKGEKNMKKLIMMVVMMMVLVSILTGCSDLHRKDEDNATVSVTTSDGQAYVYQSVNGSDSIFSGKEYALRYFKKEIDMKIGETIHIVFECDACGNKQEIEVDSAFAGVIQCDCPEKMDENGNAREYIAFEINYYTEEELFYKRKYEQTMFGDFDNK